MVTISHFSPYGCSNGPELVNSMLQNPSIDILSPQLYTSGMEPQNDWTGYSDAWRSSIPAVAPSIVQAYYYDQLGSNSVTSYLPNAKGYFVWSDTPTPPPGPTPDCVRCVESVGVRMPWTPSINPDLICTHGLNHQHAAGRSRAVGVRTCVHGKLIALCFMVSV